MARKGSRKILRPQKCEGYLERFAYDILKCTLLACGLPKEKLKSEERNKNDYADYNIANAGVSVLNIALNGRDDWKSMFESRFKSLGFNTFEKIKDYLKSFFLISRDFRICDNSMKIKISLAVYSEMILFLSYKDIEFDFEQMIILWRTHFLELAPQITWRKEASELLQDLFERNSSSSKYKTWLYSFVNYMAVPYGSKTDVSVVFLQRLNELEQIQEKVKEDLVSNIDHLILLKTNVLDRVLPSGFESQAVLPGDNESLEPPEYCSTKTASGKNKARKQSTRPVVPPSFVPLDVLKDNFESSKPPEGCSTNSNIRRKEKILRKQSDLSKDAKLNSSTEQGIEDKFGKRSLRSQQPEPPEYCSTETVSGKNIARRQAVKPVEPPGFEPVGVLKDNGEPPKTPEGCSTNSNIRRKEKKLQ